MNKEKRAHVINEMWARFFIVNDENSKAIHGLLASLLLRSLFS